MQVIFIHHSCFLVEVDEKVLIFDWFAGKRIKGYTFHGVIPEYESDTPIYVFASHKHQDHFDMDVLHWAEKYKNIHYIFSKDCKMSPHFLQKHGFLENIREKITYVSAGEKYQVDDVKIETLRSTDAGVAFYVETHGATFFHAGDLNDWIPGSTALRSLSAAADKMPYRQAAPEHLLQRTARQILSLCLRQSDNLQSRPDNSQNKSRSSTGSPGSAGPAPFLYCNVSTNW